MDLFLLRHADALDQAPSDLARPLSEKGRQQAEKLALFFTSAKLKPAQILSSPALRTLETAAPIAHALALPVLPCEWALPGMHPDDAIDALKSFRDSGPVLLVGHQPDIALFAARLLSYHSPERLRISKASLMHLHLYSEDSAELEFFLPCNLI
jgi:phosphohistidine phosphatase